MSPAYDGAVRGINESSGCEFNNDASKASKNTNNGIVVVVWCWWGTSYILQKLRYGLKSMGSMEALLPGRELSARKVKP